MAGYFQQEFKAVYVMRAPNCENRKFKASKAQKSAYYYALVFRLLRRNPNDAEALYIRTMYQLPVHILPL